MKKINLEEILDSHIGFASSIPPAKHFYINAMLDACRQILELAAENAQTKSIVFVSGRIQTTTEIVNKQSILNTINQVE